MHGPEVTYRMLSNEMGEPNGMSEIQKKEYDDHGTQQVHESGPVQHEHPTHGTTVVCGGSGMMGLAAYGPRVLKPGLLHGMEQGCANERSYYHTSRQW